MLLGLQCVQAAFETIAGIEGHLEQLLGEKRVLALRDALNRIIAGRKCERGG